MLLPSNPYLTDILLESLRPAKERRQKFTPTLSFPLLLFFGSEKGIN
jgi:hypothetical protein